MTNNLRAWRKHPSRGWTLVDVHGLTGVSVSYLSLIERGLRRPNAETKVKIARGMGAKVIDLFPAAEVEVGV